MAFDYRIMAKRKGYENVPLAGRMREFEMPKPERRGKVSARPLSARELAARGLPLTVFPDQGEGAGLKGVARSGVGDH